jgi:1-acyl-sn-glycerol-3-phosphate acyltransferase
MSARPSTLLSAFNWILFIGVSVLNLSLGALLQILALPLDRSKRLCLWVNHWIWGRMLYAVEVFWPLRRQGYERVANGPYIVVSNHGSVLDIPANMTLPLPLRVVGKTSLFEVPLMGWYMRFSRQIPLDAEDPVSVTNMMTCCQEALAEGVSVLIFPEGTRTADGTLGVFNRGAFRLAKDLGVQLLPVVVEGTRDILPKGSLRPARPHDAVTVQVLDPVDPRTFSTARKLSNTVRRSMEAVLKQPSPEELA